ncbi:transcriptional regulator [Caulobacter radicis]|uniref:helix-turn-helix domain-containing protein n=1 Tax=Caulobacter radicis TaxID=2172650 RepID=UPI000D573CEE|nr:helix-turn-helix transcriptional regulator [Caulobacter radicis]PVM84490.1 transcriptional regulator [Caulobacter radicis]
MNVKAETRGPDPIDIFVGTRVRVRRKALGITQEKLGDRLGLTFQQIQKYERGANRISASKLYAIARALGVPVAFFFDGLVDPAGSREDGERQTQSARMVMDFMASSEGVELAEHFPQIRRGSIRRLLLDLVKAMIADGDETAD